MTRRRWHAMGSGIRITSVFAVTVLAMGFLDWLRDRSDEDQQRGVGADGVVVRPEAPESSAAESVDGSSPDGVVVREAESHPLADHTTRFSGSEHDPAASVEAADETAQSSPIDDAEAPATTGSAVARDESGAAEPEATPATAADDGQPFRSADPVRSPVTGVAPTRGDAGIAAREDRHAERLAALDARVTAIEDDLEALSATVGTLDAEFESIRNSLDGIRDDLRGLLDVYQAAAAGAVPAGEPDRGIDDGPAPSTEEPSTRAADRGAEAGLDSGTVGDSDEPSAATDPATDAFDDRTVESRNVSIRADETAIESDSVTVRASDPEPEASTGASASEDPSEGPANGESPEAPADEGSEPSDDSPASTDAEASRDSAAEAATGADGGAGDHAGDASEFDWAGQELPVQSVAGANEGDDPTGDGEDSGRIDSTADDSPAVADPTDGAGETRDAGGVDDGNAADAAEVPDPGGVESDRADLDATLDPGGVASDRADPDATLDPGGVASDRADPDATPGSGGVASDGADVDAAPHEAALADDGLSKPYVTALPDGFATEALVIEWLDWLVSRSDPETAVEAVVYYERLEWVTGDVAEELLGYLDGLVPVDTVDDPVGRPEQLALEIHRRSLEYVRTLASGEVTADGI